MSNFNLAYTLRVMSSGEIIKSFSDFKQLFRLSSEDLSEFIRDTFLTVLRKKFDGADNFDVTLNPDKGDIEIYRTRIVVSDEELENENEEITLTQARKIEDDFEIGEEVSELIDPNDLGRRTIFSIKQLLTTKIKEAQALARYEIFKDRLGQIVYGVVHHVRGRDITIMDESNNEMILPKRNMLPSERTAYAPGDLIKSVIEDVDLRKSNPVVILSRVSPLFLHRLFEDNITEVKEGLITVKKVARAPGEKSKVVVDSYDDRIDPVGSCVGVRGSRIRHIVNELRGESIDVINHTDSEKLLIARVLNVPSTSKIEVDEEHKTASVFLDSEHVSRAIGRGGSNIRLASEITGYQIDIFSHDAELTSDIELSEFSDEIDTWIIQELKKIGCDTARSVLDMSKEEVAQRADLEEETVVRIFGILKEELGNSDKQ